MFPTNITELDRNEIKWYNIFEGRLKNIHYYFRSIIYMITSIFNVNWIEKISSYQNVGTCITWEIWRPFTYDNLCFASCALISYIWTVLPHTFSLNGTVPIHCYTSIPIFGKGLWLSDPLTLFTSVKQISNTKF